jgi:hypothetical protein
MTAPQRPEWPPTSDHELPIVAVCGMWQDAARDWHDWALRLEARIEELERALKRAVEGGLNG